MKMEKLKKLDNRVKVVVAICILLLVGVIGFKLTRNALANPDSNYLSNQIVDGLSFENASLTTENGISKYTVEVVNDNSSNYSLKIINVVFKDSEGNETTLLGYIGESLSSNEKKVLDISIDEEMTDVASITYSINK